MHGEEKGRLACMQQFGMKNLIGPSMSVPRCNKRQISLKLKNLEEPEEKFVLLKDPNNIRLALRFDTDSLVGSNELVSNMESRGRS